MVRIVCLMSLLVTDDWTGRQRIAGKHTGHETTTERYERFHLCRRTRRTEYWRLQYCGGRAHSRKSMLGPHPGRLTMTMIRCPPNISPNGCVVGIAPLMPWPGVIPLSIPGASVTTCPSRNPALARALVN